MSVTPNGLQLKPKVGRGFFLSLASAFRTQIGHARGFNNQRRKRPVRLPLYSCSPKTEKFRSSSAIRRGFSGNRVMTFDSDQPQRLSSLLPRGFSLPLRAGGAGTGPREASTTGWSPENEAVSLLDRPLLFLFPPNNLSSVPF